MHVRAAFLALLLAAPSAGLAHPAVSPAPLTPSLVTPSIVTEGFGWDSGPGRHNPARSTHAGRAGGAKGSTAAVDALELRRAIQDGHIRLRSREELLRIEQRDRSAARRDRQRTLRTQQLAIEAWERRQLRRLDSADRQLDLDAARLPLSASDAATLRLDRDIDRARQRVELKRAAGRVKRGPSRAVRRAIGPRF